MPNCHEKRPEFPTGSLVPGSARVVLENAIGKTITSLSFGPDPSTDKLVHDGEYLTLRFSDGSSLEIELGSNVGNIAIAFERGQKTFTAPSVRLSFIPFFYPAE